MADENDARDALNMWYDDGSPWAPGWHEHEVAAMKAALNADTVDAALDAFGISQGDPLLTSPAQDRANWTDMQRLRHRATV